MCIGPVRGRSAAVALWLPWLGSPGNLSQPPSAWGIRLPIETIVKSARLVSARAYATARSTKNERARWLSVPIGAGFKTRLSAVQTDRAAHAFLRHLIFKSFLAASAQPGFRTSSEMARAPLSRLSHNGNAPFWAILINLIKILDFLLQSCSGMLQHPPRLSRKSRRPM